mmetsp:Transcript_14031/g.51017  ORF Transcript_14031/g.51017 Transcript_14031/m.51017 type:complete len:248 (+) Transcript_14031:343-1086(+)
MLGMTLSLLPSSLRRAAMASAHEGGCAWVALGASKPKAAALFLYSASSPGRNKTPSSYERTMSWLSFFCRAPQAALDRLCEVRSAHSTSPSRGAGRYRRNVLMCGIACRRPRAPLKRHQCCDRKSRLTFAAYPGMLTPATHPSTEFLTSSTVGHTRCSWLRGCLGILSAASFWSASAALPAARLARNSSCSHFCCRLPRDENWQTKWSPSPRSALPSSPELPRFVNTCSLSCLRSDIWPHRCSAAPE